MLLDDQNDNVEQGVAALGWKAAQAQAPMALFLLQLAPLVAAQRHGAANAGGMQGAAKVIQDVLQGG